MSRPVRVQVAGFKPVGVFVEGVVSSALVAQSVPRCVPVASVKRQLSSVASQFVASASPRAVLSSTILKCRRAAATNKSKRTLERLAKPSASGSVKVASRTIKPRHVAYH